MTRTEVLNLIHTIMDEGKKKGLDWDDPRLEELDYHDHIFTDYTTEEVEPDNWNLKRVLKCQQVINEMGGDTETDDYKTKYDELVEYIETLWGVYFGKDKSAPEASSLQEVIEFIDARHRAPQGNQSEVLGMKIKDFPIKQPSQIEVLTDAVKTIANALYPLYDDPNGRSLHHDNKLRDLINKLNRSNNNDKQ